jgi:hypothetical protein
VNKKAQDKQKHFMAETAAFFEKMEKHQFKPSNKNTKKYPYGENRK